LFWMTTIICRILGVYPPMMATLLWLRKVCIWLHKGYVGHRKIWWGYGCTIPPCLHWYTTVVTWRRRNSSKWWHIILLHTSFLGRGKTFSYNPSLLFFFAGTRSPSSHQSYFPQEKVFIFLPKRANSPWPL
jgi:hypothetical protein